MKVSKANIFFSGIYKSSFNYEKEPLKPYALSAFAMNENAILVYNHQGYEPVKCFLESALRKGLIPSLNWLIKHAELKNLELPDFINNNEVDAYILTGKDRYQFEQVSKYPQKAKKILLKELRKGLKHSKNNPNLMDTVINTLADYSENEQKKFNDFLKDKKVSPIKFNIEA